MRLPTYRAADAYEEPAQHAAAIDDAQSVADLLGIQLTVLDCSREFEQNVVNGFCDAYQRGLTPNPCARCNERMKFGHLLDEAQAQGFALLATGHYVRKDMEDGTGRMLLRRGMGADEQSYFLYGLTQQQLGKAVFPLARHVKADVRRMAADMGLPVHDKPKSQDLCFLPDGRYRDFLRSRCPQAFQPGDIVHVSGQVMGRHDGIAGYTLGQRRGLGIAYPEPLYVVSVDAQANTVTVGERECLFYQTVLVRDVNWMGVAQPSEPLGAVVKIRYNHEGGEARLTPLPDGRVKVDFVRAQEAPCPGQSAVFYDGDIVLGGGSIERPLRGAEE